MSTRTPVFKDHPIAALVVICLSVFVISVDATIVNVALPTLSRELNADTAQLQWIVDAYTLVMSGLLLSAGSLSDRYGRRGWLSGGLAAFAVTSAIAAQVNTADGLIAARAAMGIGAAVIFPTTLGLITNIFTDPVKRAKAIGLVRDTQDTAESFSKLVQDGLAVARRGSGRRGWSGGGSDPPG